MRDNARDMGGTIATRIQERLAVIDQSKNAVSEAAGLDRDYISDLLKKYESGIPQSPRWETIVKLADALRCDPAWLARGDGEADVASHHVREAVHLMASLPEDQREDALTVLRALHARHSKPKAG